MLLLMKPVKLGEDEIFDLTILYCLPVLETIGDTSVVL